MPSLMVVTIQSAILKAAANITAQTLSQWGAEEPTELDWARVAEFAVFGLVSAPLVCFWQRALEESFPTQNGVVSNPHAQSTARKKDQPHRLNWRNVLLKLFLDQTIGLFFINVIFITCTTGARLQSTSLIAREIEMKIVGILKAGWRIWPPVALINFLWVPWQWRVVVTSVVGFGWNIILSFLSK
ncbi:hypothetical protein P170DRAFT_354961 [Aspergillus steynii IBT 23096]|uniref:Integral membrane protein, Mpv17/PMP22 family n=1 Tax=Aspergillus steynii IBT 23096 TaxID=1392250 RepID=A0A2I2GAL2_9EURO|nr:uncharacterized protein P170DRAFT_354961 [Aspergillus steynii IBT 23096]PLB49921.1 hypothetical protein P170DRAFT_354961 [Aspergillus steynii IBT 23096]